MAIDEPTNRRLRSALGDVAGISEKRMMGGTSFFLHGNMIAGADRPKGRECRFMFRVGKARNDEVAALPGADAMVQGGRRMRGFFFVEAALCDEALLKAYLGHALAHARSLPPK